MSASQIITVRVEDRWSSLQQPWKRGVVSLAAALIGGVLVLVQGFTVGLFGGSHAGFHLWSFLLHVVVMGPLPVGAFFVLADDLSLPDDFVIDVAAASLATGVILIGVYLFGGLTSNNQSLLKFAVTVYGAYAAVYGVVRLRQGRARRAARSDSSDAT